jgi:DNA integrity scanning protein DisA with diadenylate cyclase activity
MKTFKEIRENKNLIKDYETYMAKGDKKTHNAIDFLMSMSKYKRYNRDQMAKIIGNHLRKNR